MELELNDTRDALTLRIASPLTAVAVEQLIAQLTQARMDMAPEVPPTFAQARDADAPVTDLGEPHVVFKPESAGLRFFIRGAGCGWLILVYPEHGFDSLRQILGEQRPERGLPH